MGPGEEIQLPKSASRSVDAHQMSPEILSLAQSRSNPLREGTEVGIEGANDNPFVVGRGFMQTYEVPPIQCDNSAIFGDGKREHF